LPILTPDNEFLTPALAALIYADVDDTVEID
jgi:hypothetical protein